MKRNFLLYIIFEYLLLKVNISAYSQTPSTPAEKIPVSTSSINHSPIQFYIGIGGVAIKNKISYSFYPSLSDKWESNLLFIDLGFKVNFSNMFIGIRASGYSQDESDIMKHFEQKSEIAGILGFYTLNPGINLYLMLGLAQIPLKSVHVSTAFNKFSPALFGIGIEYNISTYATLLTEIAAYYEEQDHYNSEKLNKIKFEQTSIKIGLRFYPGYTDF